MCVSFRRCYKNPFGFEFKRTRKLMPQTRKCQFRIGGVAKVRSGSLQPTRKYQFRIGGVAKVCSGLFAATTGCFHLPSRRQERQGPLSQPRQHQRGTARKRVELLGEGVGELWPRKCKPLGPWLRFPPQTEAAAFKSQLALRSSLTQTGWTSS